MRLPDDAPRWSLLQAHAPQADGPALAAALRELGQDPTAPLRRAALRTATTGGPGAAEDIGLLYAYFAGPLDARAATAALPSCRQIRVSPLQPTFETRGAAAGAAARFHYVVETDPEAGWHGEIARWYDEEHMPGLAAVPGCIRAWRALNLGMGPLSLAAYDLVAAEVLGSPPWLDVRGTAWSDRTRPHFTNTRRTMFAVID